MSNLFILNETFTNGLNYNLLNIITFSSIICGIFVITSKNPVVSVLSLIGLFFNVAGYLMMLGINFIDLSYLLVYVGAVSILFLFILMLINVRISELVTDNNNSLPLALVINSTFNLILHKLLAINFSLYLSSPPKPHAFTDAPVESVSSLWTLLFGAGPVLYMTTKGPVYAKGAERALGVILEAPGCSISNGKHTGEIISITILDHTWYGYEQCSIILHCTKCHLETTYGPVASILIKAFELGQIQGF